MNLKNPNEKGRFGPFGGRYIPETLVPACHELEKSFKEAWEDDSFRKELDSLLSDYAGRPSPITECFNLSAELNCRLLLKREDLNHTGSHKINNVLMEGKTGGGITGSGIACSGELCTFTNITIKGFKDKLKVEGELGRRTI